MDKFQKSPAAGSKISAMTSVDSSIQGSSCATGTSADTSQGHIDGAGAIDQGGQPGH